MVPTVNSDMQRYVLVGDKKNLERVFFSSSFLSFFFFLGKKYRVAVVAKRNQVVC